MKNSLVHALCASAAAATLSTAADGATVRYRAVLAQPPFASGVLAVNDINDAGALAGTAGLGTVNPGFHATLWEDGGVTNLDVLFTISEGQVINDAGVVAGVGSFCPPLNGPCTGFIARALPGGTFDLIGTLGGPNGEILDINTAGDFTGWWYQENFQPRALLVTEKDGPLNLGTLGGFASRAHALNDHQQIVGQSYTANNTLRAFLWQDQTMTDLGTLGGASSSAADINEGGIVIGWAATNSGHSHAFRYTVDGGMQDIQTLGQAVESRALAINDAGMIAGVWNDGSIERLFRYTEADGMIDLGALDVPDFIQFGQRIHLNNDGAMVGVALAGSYQQVPWFWSPEAGLRALEDLVVNRDELAISVASGINGSGQIAVSGTAPATLENKAAVLEPVAATDINADGLINVSDLLAVIAAWGDCGVGGPCDADVDSSGAVDVLDLLAVIAAWS